MYVIKICLLEGEDWYFIRGALQRMFERKMAVEQPVKAKIKVQVRIKISNA